MSFAHANKHYKTAAKLPNQLENSPVWVSLWPQLPLNRCKSAPVFWSVAVAAVWLNLGSFFDDLGVKFDECVDETSVFLIRQNTL